MRWALACHRPQDQPIPSHGFVLEPNLGSRCCRGRGGVRSIKTQASPGKQPLQWLLSFGTSESSLLLILLLLGFIRKMLA